MLNSFCNLLAKAADHSQAHTNRWLFVTVRLQRAIPVAVVHIHRARLEVVAARVLKNLVGAVETHGPAVDQRTGERGRLMAFQPAAGVGQQGEAGRMGLGETVAAETLDLFEDARGELLGVAPGKHALGQAFLVGFKPAVTLPGRHGSTQLIGLAGSVFRGDDGQFHHLFLEQRHAQGALENRQQLLRGIDDRLLSVSPAQVGMHHVALNRPGPDDGHLDHQVVEGPGLEPRQHGHLRPGFDLEHANGIGTADHLVGRLVLGGNGGDGPARLVAVAADQIEAAAQCAEHAQGEDVHLQQAHQVQVVLVPLDDGAIVHGGVFHRHQAVQRLFGNHEAAGVLRQMPRKTEQFAGQYQHPAQQRIVRVEAAFTQALGRR